MNKLDLIKQKVAEAGVPVEDGVDCPSCRATTDRPVRLSDVLLAIEKAGLDVVISPDADGACFGKVVKGRTAFDDAFTVDWSLAFWNLREDDLSKQSEETISFLYDLLK